jgi:hypothetical protein
MPTLMIRMLAQALREMVFEQEYISEPLQGGRYVEVIDDYHIRSI